MFENKFTITKDIIREYQMAFWFHRKQIKVLGAILSIIIVASIFLMKYFILFDIGLILFAASLLYVRIRNEINLEYQRYQTIYKNHEITAHYRFDKAITIINDINGKENETALSTIVKLIESKHMYILLLKANIIVPIKKDAFMKGNEKDFKEFINQCIAANTSK